MGGFRRSGATKKKLLIRVHSLSIDMLCYRAIIAEHPVSRVPGRRVARVAVSCRLRIKT